jgi:uncharacterized membrane protein
MPFQIEQNHNRASDFSEALSVSDRGAPHLHVVLTPYRSLTPQGFVWFIGLTAGLLCLPLLAMIGTVVMWALLPFIVLVLLGIWIALKRSWRDRTIREDLRLWSDHIELYRIDPGHAPRNWQANPYWIRVVLHPYGGPVPNYLTLAGADREVELGAFLTPVERVELKRLLDSALRPI